MKWLLFTVFIFYLVSQVSPAPPPPDWEPRIRQANMLFAETEPVDKSMMASIGNGYLATVVGQNFIYLSGVFNGRNYETPSHRAVIPATNSFTIEKSTPTGSALDLEKATYYRRGTIGSATFEQRWYAHRALRSILVHEIFIDNSASESNLTFSLSLNTTTSTDFITTRLNNGPNYSQYYGTIVTTEEPNGFVTSISVVSSLVASTYSVPAKQSTTFYFVTAIRTNLDSVNPNLEAVLDYTNAVKDLPNLHPTHVAAWLELWDSRIEIGGDLSLAQVVNSSLYYILSSVRDDWPYSLSPGSLASDGYNGHVFWDCETWMYPVVLLTHPDIATGGILKYRLDRTNGAALKAKSYNKGYTGLMFPWESAFTGNEVTPSWAPTGEMEQHITGDVAFAFKQYWYLTQDIAWLTNVYPVIEGMAEFWASRVEYDEVNRVYEINNIIPPDEYAINVNNSVFTNVVAAMSLDFAIHCAKLLGKTVPVDKWLDIITNIKIPLSEDKTYHLEYDTYAGETIKQADVILLGFPLMLPMSPAMREKDLSYYQERTDFNGPSMTFAMETIGWLELKKYEEAEKIWHNSYLNAKEPFLIWRETPTDGVVNFITGAGGFLQAVIYGFGGVRLYETSMMFDPVLPPTATNVTLNRIHFRGNELKVWYDDSTCNIQAFNSGGPPLVLSIGGVSKLLGTAPITFPCSQFYVSPQ